MEQRVPDLWLLCHSLDFIGCNTFKVEHLNFIAAIICKVNSITVCLLRCLLQSLQKVMSKLKSDTFQCMDSCPCKKPVIFCHKDIIVCGKVLQKSATSSCVNWLPSFRIWSYCPRISGIRVLMTYSIRLFNIKVVCRSFIVRQP